MEDIENAKEEIEERLEEIKSAHELIIKDTETDYSLKTQIENLVTSFEQSEEKIEKFKKDIFGVKNPDGTSKKGLFENISSFYIENKKKTEELLREIETDLKSAATARNLAAVFEKKVDEYHKEGNFFQWVFIILVLLVIGYFAAATFNTEKITTIYDTWVHLLYRLPLLSFVVWLAIFFGSRRAENKKLEESYKHKEVMARSFIGYREAIKELDDEDITLLKEHMNNLLRTMNNDSSVFLTTKEEGHPLFNFVSSGKKETSAKE